MAKKGKDAFDGSSHYTSRGYSGSSHSGLFGTTVHTDSGGHSVGHSWDTGSGSHHFSWDDGSRGDAVHLWGDTYHYTDSAGRSGTVYINDSGSVKWDMGSYTMPFEPAYISDEEESARREAEELDIYSSNFNDSRIDEHLSLQGLDYDELCEMSELRRIDEFADAGLSYSLYERFFEHLDDEELMREEMLMGTPHPDPDYLWKYVEAFDLDYVDFCCVNEYIRRKIFENLDIDYDLYALAFEEESALYQMDHYSRSDIPTCFVEYLEETGLDYDALCEVNEAERREAFENADLDYDACALYFEHVDEAFNEDETLEFSVDFEWEEAPNEKATEQMQRSKLKSCGLNEFKLRAMKEKDRMALVRKAGLDAKEYEIYLFSCEPGPEICSAALAEAGLDAELLRCLPSDMRMARIAEKGYDPEDFEYGFFAECTLLGIFAEELLDVDLDYEELQLLPEKKRRNAITNAGLDPDRYLPLFQGIHEESALIRELASAGLFYGLLCGMDAQKRRAAIEEKGLDAEDYAAIFPKKGE